MDGHIIAGSKKGCYLINSFSEIKIIANVKVEKKTWYGGTKFIETVNEIKINSNNIDSYIIDYKLVSSKRAPSPVRGAITGRTLFGRKGAKVGLIAGMIEENMHMGKQVEIFWTDGTISLVEMKDELYETLVRFMYDIQHKKMKFTINSSNVYARIVIYLMNVHQI